MSLTSNPSCRVLRRALGVNVNALGDVRLIAPFSRYRVLAFSTTNASTSLAATAATLGLYTAASAGGTAIVTAATASLTPLSAATKIKDCTLANTDVQTAQTLYVNVGVVHGSAATVDVYIEYQQLF